jgi:oligopeptide/dipeptide ABC transporter ATP-binding protein
VNNHRPAEEDRKQPLLEIEDLRGYFRTSRGLVKAVDGVSFSIDAGASVGIVGESGSGKSVTAVAIAGLLEPPGYLAGGTIRLAGKDITGLSDRQLQHVRGRDIGMVFQEPMAALNPVVRVGKQIAEAIRAHNDMSRTDAMAKAVDLLRMVGIPAPERRIRDYPNSMSGGMRQRVVIAMAIANQPQLLILDEPTTALDVTVQAQILALVKELRERIGTAVLLITHDIGVIVDVCDEVIVMYGGRIMEHASVEQVVKTPKHPYSIGLLDSVPSGKLKGHRLNAIRGSVPSPNEMPPGCPFASRCPKVFDKCIEMPPLHRLDDGRRIACWLYEEETHDERG